MWTQNVDDSEFIIDGLVYPQKAYIKELPTGWKPRCKTYEECKKRKTMSGLLYGQLYQIDELKCKEGEIMDSAKKSVEKILEIARKHGYDCVVAFKKGDDGCAGVIALAGDTTSTDFLHAYDKLSYLNVLKGKDEE